jgi:hypothetical protein
VRRFFKRRRRVPLVAIDSSGLDCGHASRYYVNRRAKGQRRAAPPAQHTSYRCYAKLEAVFDCGSHLILAAFGGRGPRPDTDRFVPLLDAALSRVSIGTALADAGYDSEPNHVHARERRGVRSVIPATAGRPSERGPSGRWRRVMKRNLGGSAGFLYCGYGQRWQAECGISMIKRRQAVAVAARSAPAQARELMLMADARAAPGRAVSRAAVGLSRSRAQPRAQGLRRQPGGRSITRQCSGPSRRVSLLWFERRRGVGSAADRPYVSHRRRAQ